MLNIFECIGKGDLLGNPWLEPLMGLLNTLYFLYSENEFTLHTYVFIILHFFFWDLISITGVQF